LDILEIIETKKRGQALAPEIIASVVAEFTADRLPAYQMAAWLMAIWFRGMTANETAALTKSMLESGEQLATDDLGGPTADKHSTGGVGDKVSLLLAPLAAACGLRVPMLSGRGLGHTGGTLDKLEAIPGYRIHLSNAEFLATVREIGCAIVGQSETIAPADGKIYALRDVTGTVDSVPLITASIMAKKLAAGPQTIVIDLKTGSGAFMDDDRRSRELAAALQRIGRRWQRRVAVLLTDMDQPLGVTIGHALETVEAFAALSPDGRRGAPADLVVLTEELTAEMVRVAGVRPDRECALDLVRQVWESGEAFAQMERWVAAQNGRIDPGRADFGLELAPPILDVGAAEDGFLQKIDCRAVGRSLVEIGGARREVGDPIDSSVGVSFRARVGDRVTAAQPVATVHGRDRDAAARTARRITDALTIGPEKVTPRQLIIDRLAEADQE
jgi:pyrimidine-nucleoside phosphorylase/thymidine phosphorylase